VKQAVDDGLAGDRRAREWVANYLLGKPERGICSSSLRGKWPFSSSSGRGRVASLRRSGCSTFRVGVFYVGQVPKSGMISYGRTPRRNLQGPNQRPTPVSPTQVHSVGLATLPLVARLLG
jgi:hypothetical protein